MAQETSRAFRGLPGMLFNYAKVVTSGKPLLAPEGVGVGRIAITADNVRVRASHLARYRKVCAIPDSNWLPPAYLHVLAMPLHMYVFSSPVFPVKVLGLIHLRNTIRCRRPIAPDAPLRLSVGCQAMRETPGGQEFDLLTSCELDGQVVWDEVSTMLARRVIPGQRPKIERAGDAQVKTELDVPVDTGRRYAWVSGDLNPIHLSAKTAGWFGFKQAVAHGMWSIARSLGEAAHLLPTQPIQIETYFKLPLYLPSKVIFRCQQSDHGISVSLSSGKGDRLHLITDVRLLSN
jgi:acyl dehydratase